MIKYICVFVGGVFISSFSQILLKKSANRTYESRIKEYLNVLVISAYGLFFFSTFLSLYAYKVIPLSMGPILEATGYLWVALLSWGVLGEKIKIRKMIGLVVILLGIIVYSVG